MNYGFFVSPSRIGPGAAAVWAPCSLVASCKKRFPVLRGLIGSVEYRQPILISGGPDHINSELLAAPAVSDGTGFSQTTATMEALKDWECVSSAVALCYDITHKTPAMARVLSQDLKNYPTSRQKTRAPSVLELIIGVVATKLFGQTTGPSDHVFEELKRW